jgi:hypothetical protein
MTPEVVSQMWLASCRGPLYAQTTAKRYFEGYEQMHFPMTPEVVCQVQVMLAMCPNPVYEQTTAKRDYEG